MPVVSVPTIQQDISGRASQALSNNQPIPFLTERIPHTRHHSDIIDHTSPRDGNVLEKCSCLTSNLSSKSFAFSAFLRVAPTLQAGRRRARVLVLVRTRRNTGGTSTGRQGAKLARLVYRHQHQQAREERIRDSCPPRTPASRLIPVTQFLICGPGFHSAAASSCLLFPRNRFALASANENCRCHILFEEEPVRQNCRVRIQKQHNRQGYLQKPLHQTLWLGSQKRASNSAGSLPSSLAYSVPSGFDFIAIDWYILQQDSATAVAQHHPSSRRSLSTCHRPPLRQSPCSLSRQKSKRHCPNTTRVADHHTLHPRCTASQHGERNRFRT